MKPTPPQNHPGQPIWKTIRWLVLAGLIFVLGGFLVYAISFASHQSEPAGPLIFYNWEGDLPQSIIDDFQQEFGVEVIYKVYETQEAVIEELRAGQSYDVVVMESRFIPILVKEGLLAPLDYHNLPNSKYISPAFRDLLYDPGNLYSVPYNWGTTALIVRKDLLEAPVTRWADLWTPLCRACGNMVRPTGK